MSEYACDETLLRRLRDRIRREQGAGNSPSLASIDRVLVAYADEYEAQEQARQPRCDPADVAHDTVRRTADRMAGGRR